MHEATLSPVRPDVSIVMPCYNEQAIVAYTLQRLTGAFHKAGYRLELIAVDNGSRDRTGEIIRAFAAKDESVIPYRIEVNEGYGHGVLQGLARCTAPWVGMIPADGQIDAEDVVRLYEAVATTDGKVVGKVRRRFRMDGIRRKIVSGLYNLLIRMLWPSLQSVDVNATPKLFPRQALQWMQLKSKGWVLDLELMVKAHYLGLRVLELNVFARMRSNGLSHVRMTTCWEFLRSILGYRFSPEVARWRREVEQAGIVANNLTMATDPAQQALCTQP
jgi:dolichol-phosphate mannosyltransferase